MLGHAREISDELIETRRTLHRHPELSYQEHRTGELVAERLRALGLAPRVGAARTGVVAELGSGDRIIVVRADMDALPIQELTGATYVSQVPGVMHACGHDAHTSCALGAAALLAGARLAGRVRFVFQPSEEGMDEEGKSGAMRMVEEGVMAGAEAAIALHVDPMISYGDVVVAPGPAWSGLEYFRIEVLGRSAHGALPHQGVDAIQLASHVTLALHNIVSRRVDPLQTGVVTVGSVVGGTKSNIIADRVTLNGALRYFREDVHATLRAEIDRACRVAAALGGDYRLTFGPGLPATVNTERLTALVQAVASDLLGPEHVRMEGVILAAEDFGILSHGLESTIFRLGVKAGDALLHNPYFDIDERALPIGAAILAETARRYLT